MHLFVIILVLGVLFVTFEAIGIVMILRNRGCNDTEEACSEHARLQTLGGRIALAGFLPLIAAVAVFGWWLYNHYYVNASNDGSITSDGSPIMEPLPVREGGNGEIPTMVALPLMPPLRPTVVVPPQLPRQEGENLENPESQSAPVKKPADKPIVASNDRDERNDINNDSVVLVDTVVTAEQPPTIEAAVAAIDDVATTNGGGSAKKDVVLTPTEPVFSTTMKDVAALEKTPPPPPPAIIETW